MLDDQVNVTTSDYQDHTTSGRMTNRTDEDAPEFGVGPSKLVEEDQAQDSVLLKRNNNMLVVAGDPGKKDDPSMVTLTPMTPLVASSTVVNLLLATGPFA